MRDTSDKLKYASLLSGVSDIIRIIYKQLMDNRIESKSLYVKATPDGEFSVFYGEEDKGWLDG